MKMSVEEWLANAKMGHPTLVGPLLDRYRNYLRLLAQLEVGRHLQSKLDASDVVQETYLEAHRHFHLFRGGSEAQFLGWLRQILAATLANQLRRFMGTKARDVRLEQQLGESLDRSSIALNRAFASPISSPSQQATKREQNLLLANALAELPADYRDVIVLRNLEGLRFPEIADRMGRSQDSVEKLWMRGLGRLRQLLGKLNEP